MATNMMANNPDDRIIFFSLEMPSRQVIQRLYSHVFDVSSQDVQSSITHNALPAQLGELAQRLPQQVVVDRPNLGLSDMSAYLERYDLFFGHRPDLVIMDYLEEIGGAKAGAEGWIRTEATASAVKTWAKDEMVGVFLLHQASQKTEPWEPVGSSSAKGGGFAQPVSEPVLTPDGFVPMGTLKVGDTVVGSDGQPTLVTGVFPLGTQQVFEVKFRDGGSTRATAEHLWEVQSDNQRCLGGSSVVHTFELATRKGGHSVPTVQPIPGKLLPLPIDPYVLGAILGDGSFSKKRTHLWDFTGEVASNIRKSHYKVAGKGIRGHYSIPGILAEVRGLGLMGKKSRDKFVPDMYLRATIRQRLSMLRGLMDTDGTTSDTRASYATTSPHLRDNVVELVRSLGGLTSVSTTNTPFGPAWDVYLYDLPFNPFRMPSKAHKYAPSGNTHPRRVVSVELVGEEEVQCISVGAPNNLYVTKDYIVTHNSESDVVMGAWRPGRDPYLGEVAQAQQANLFYINVLKNRVTGELRNELRFTLDNAMRIRTERVRLPAFERTYAYAG